MMSIKRIFAPTKAPVPKKINSNKNLPRSKPIILQARVLILSAENGLILTAHTSLTNLQTSLLRFTISKVEKNIEQDVMKNVAKYSNSTPLFLMEFGIVENFFDKSLVLTKIFVCFVKFSQRTLQDKRAGTLFITPFKDINTSSTSSFFDNACSSLRELSKNSELACMLCVFLVQNEFSYADIKDFYFVLFADNLNNYRFNNAIKSSRSIDSLGKQKTNNPGATPTFYRADLKKLKDELQVVKTLSLRVD